MLEEVCGPLEDRHGMGWAEGERDIIFYTDYGRISGRDTEWAKEALMATVAIFRRLGLATNIKKPKDMVYTPGFIWGK